MKRTKLILTGAPIAAASLAAVSLAASIPAAVAGAGPHGAVAQASRAAVVSQRQTGIGRILVSSSGRTLYEFTRDHANSSSCAAASGCPEAWPPLQSSGRPIAGAGVRASLLSTIRGPGGARQVTYAGHPLYLYSGDSGPAETSYVGARQFGGSWYAINASGRAVR